MKTLYQNLMNLCQPKDGTKSNFYYIDQAGLPHLGNRTYRVFSYHIASYSDWLQPDALECRGIMFEIDANEQPIRIAARPMAKFFNLNENPFTMNLDLTKAVCVMDKADGSLISSYMDGDVLRLKSKTSLSSDQARDAMKYLERAFDLGSFIYEMEQLGYTVNMEWVAPNNRVVIEYPEARLIVLNMRHRDTGEYIQYDQLSDELREKVKHYMVDEYEIQANDDLVAYVKKATGIEGIIVQLSDGTWFKLKTDWYLHLHTCKDSISNNKKLVATILDNHHDDLKSLFVGDEGTINRINEFEAHIVHTITHDCSKLLQVHEKHRSSERKFYAINGREELPGHLFGVYMQMYLNTLKVSVYELVVEYYKRNPELLVPQKYRVA